MWATVMVSIASFVAGFAVCWIALSDRAVHRDRPDIRPALRRSVRSLDVKPVNPNDKRQHIAIVRGKR